MLEALHTFTAFRRLRRSGRTARTDLVALQQRGLRRMVRHAYAHVPYYRALFESAGLQPEQVATVQDLERLPITTKRDLQAAGEDARMSGAFPADSLTMERTSGSTGQPFTVAMDAEFIRVRDAMFLRALTAVGYRLGDRMLLVSHASKANRTRGVLRWRYASDEAQPATLLAEINAYRPSVLYGPVTPLRLVAEHVQATGAPLHRPRLVVTTAEMLEARDHAFLGAMFGARVRECYGLTEGGFLGWECPATGGFHLAEDAAIIELVPLPGSDAARLVITNLHLRAMPFVRYDTGDLAVAAADGPCGCGATTRRLRRFKGRMADCVRLDDGRIIPPFALTTPLGAVPGLQRYQVVQTEPDRVVVRFESAPNRADSVALGVREALSPVLGAAVRISAELCADLQPAPGQKFRLVECRLASFLKSSA